MPNSPSPEIVELAELVKLYEADPDIRLAVNRDAWSVYLNRVYVLAPAILDTEVMRRASLLVWKRLGGDVMCSGYSTLFHQIDKHWDVNTNRVAIAALLTKPATSLEKFIAKAVEYCQDPEVQHKVLVKGLGGLKKYVYVRKTEENYGLQMPLRSLVAVVWRVLGGDSAIPLIAEVRRQTQFNLEATVTEVIKAMALAEAVPGFENVRFHKSNQREQLYAEAFNYEGVPLPIADQPKENEMKAYQTVNYVYGVDITSMTQEQLIAAIKRAEGEKAALSSVQAESKTIETMKADLDKAIAKMVKALDNK